MKIDWFSRGRDALTEGHPNIITDARISGADRQKWHEGWLHQAYLNGPKNIDPIARAEALATISEILKELQ